MSWRPEGWKNKYQRELDILTEGAGIQLSDSIGNLHDKRCIFEAGADALLGAQWELGIPWPPPDSLEGYILWVLGAIVDTGILYGDVKGKMVFILDEEAA